VARAHAASALAAIEGFEAPVAGWRAHATAAEVFQVRGDKTAAGSHREKARDIVLQLASNLGAENEALRRTFLTAPRVVTILEPPARKGLVRRTIR
jgi:hypothetical protein